MVAYNERMLMSAHGALSLCQPAIRFFFQGQLISMKTNCYTVLSEHSLRRWSWSRFR